jgi:hypothetical protein
MLIKFYERGMIMKIKKLDRSRKILLSVVLMITLVCGVIFYTVQKPEVTLATEVKLRTYDTLNQNEPMKESDLRDTESIKKWAMPIVEGTLKAEKRTLNDEEYQKVLNAVVKTLNDTVDAGNIDIQADGTLTDLSKSYVANAVANAIAYALPEEDLKSTVDGSTTQYKQILDIQKALNALDNSNQTLKKTVSAINNTYQNSSTDTSSQIHAVDTSLTEKLDALETELLAQIHYNKKTGDRLTKDVSDIQDILDSITSTQNECLSQVKTALANIKTLTTNVSDLAKADEETKKQLKEITNNITSVTTQIDKTQQQFTNLLNTKVKNLTDSQEALKQEITTNISKTQTSLQTLVDNRVTELTTKLTGSIDTLRKDTDSNDQKANTALNQTETTIRNEITSSKESLTKIIQQNVTQLTENMSSTKSELQQKIDKNYTDITNKQDADKKELSDKQDADKAELNSTITDVQKDLQQQISKNLDDLNKTISNNVDDLNKTIAGNKTELSNKIDKTKEEMTKSIEDTKNELNTTIDTKVTELNQTITALDQKLSASIDDTNASLAQTKADLTAVTIRVTNAETDIKNINQQITDLTAKYDTAIQKLWNQVNANSADIKALQSRLNAFIASANGHYKVDMVPGFTITAAQWKASGSNATYTFTHEYLKNCTVVDVDYASQYDISPTYSINSSTGTITIKIPASQAQNISIADIMCYHLIDDDKGKDAAVSHSDDSEKPVADEPKNDTATNTETESQDVTGHKENEDSKDTYSTLN